MVAVDKETATLVFQLLDDGKTPYAIDELGIATLRTAERLRAAHSRLRGGKSIEEIAKATGWKGKATEIQRWWDEHQRANQPQEQPQAQAQLDQVLVDARLRHFAQLTDLAQRLKDSVVDESEEVDDGVWDFRKSISYKLVIMDNGTKEVSLGVEEEPLFQGVRSHLSGNSELWDALETFKADLVSRTSDDLIPGMIYQFTSSRVPTSWDIFKEKLELVLLRGIATGRCELCPEAQPASP